jgi:hypothetical protein
MDQGVVAPMDLSYGPQCGNLCNNGSEDTTVGVNTLHTLLYHNWPNRVWLCGIRAATCALSISREWKEIDEGNTDLRRVCQSNTKVTTEQYDVLHIRVNEYTFPL